MAFDTVHWLHWLLHPRLPEEETPQPHRSPAPFVLPKAIRDSPAWETGPESSVEDTSDAVSRGGETLAPDENLTMITGSLHPAVGRAWAAGAGGAARDGAQDGGHRPNSRVHPLRGKVARLASFQGGSPGDGRQLIRGEAADHRGRF
jgi:hypothetical protein